MRGERRDERLPSGERVLVPRDWHREVSSGLTGRDSEIGDDTGFRQYVGRNLPREDFQGQPLAPTVGGEVSEHCVDLGKVVGSDSRLQRSPLDSRREAVDEWLRHDRRDGHRLLLAAEEVDPPGTFEVGQPGEQVAHGEQCHGSAEDTGELGHWTIPKSLRECEEMILLDIAITGPTSWSAGCMKYPPLQTATYNRGM